MTTSLHESFKKDYKSYNFNLVKNFKDHNRVHYLILKKYNNPVENNQHNC